MSDISEGMPLIHNKNEQSGAFSQDVLDLFKDSIDKNTLKISRSLQSLNLKATSIDKSTKESIEWLDLLASGTTDNKKVLTEIDAKLKLTNEFIKKSSDQLASDNVESLVYLDNILKELQKANGTEEERSYKKYEIKEHLSATVNEQL